MDIARGSRGCRWLGNINIVVAVLGGGRLRPWPQVALPPAMLVEGTSVILAASTNEVLRMAMRIEGERGTQMNSSYMLPVLPILYP